MDSTTPARGLPRRRPTNRRRPSCPPSTWPRGCPAGRRDPRGPAPAAATRGTPALPRRPGGRERPARAGRRAYLARIPGAVSGQRGHDRTFHAACVLIKGFGLTVDQARPLLREWNRRCVPPWSAAELEHKLRSGAAAARGRLARGATSRAAGVAARLRRAGPARSRPGEPAGAAGAARPAGVLPAIPVPRGQEANPHRLAGLFLDERFASAGEIGLRFWREEFHEWDGSAYRRIPAGEIRAELARFLAGEFDRLHRLDPSGMPGAGFNGHRAHRTPGTAAPGRSP